MTNTTTAEDKRMYLIWVAFAGMLAVAVLLGLLCGSIFNFWMCLGVFLAGFGLIAGLLLLFMGKRYVSFFSATLFIAGILFIVSRILELCGIAVNPVVMVAIAVIIIAVGLVVWIVKRK